MMQKNILLTGVGGQGTVLASKLIAAAAMQKGLPVMSAETIGMAQKGGSVFSHLRIGAGVMSPMIRRGTADLLLAFEPAEAVRMLPYLKEGGTVVVNSHPVMPVTAALKGTDYTGREMIAYLQETVPDLLVIDGWQAMQELGNPKVLNVVMLGAALKSGALDFLTEEDLLEAIRAKVKPRFVALNEKALAYYAEEERK
ncbi:indolepyruvate oxidoreductase subunit beta [Mitsuokella sp.]|uniref:indolepyruvate oxidoreductase subunit beta n=1 Tax=Mitsuokella sp. TaxID=2049034 RepID=UPI002A80D6F0|nr:indolepyruvate oxidoreductase subunit beta [Mitsuokella sp.]MDY4474506.1 indolepyruvate oxidoreductase subunit beta [Mitsuokella sp.]